MPFTRIHDFSEGRHTGTEPGPDGSLVLAPGADAGQWLSPAHPAEFDFAVASWNAPAGRVEVQVRAALAGGWSSWFSYGSWSLTGDRFSREGQSVPGVGKLETDTLLLERSASAWQMKVALSEGAVLKRLWLCHAQRAHRTPELAHRAAWGLDLPVPAFSQMVYPKGGNVWCSPTSLAMVMAFWGHTESIPEQVVPGVYDPAYGGHGNWAFNVAYAGARGFTAYVDRFQGYGELEEQIAEGTPVIASVSYSGEWLENAPIGQTGGHLLVVRGFTPEGHVIVNDPAAPEDATVRRTYKREQFRRAWLDRGGVVYRIRPE